MSLPLLPLCSTGKMADRDGGVGAYARLLLPFYRYGYWFASGQQYTFPSSELPQNLSPTIGGIKQSNPYVKAAGVCLQP